MDPKEKGEKNEAKIIDRFEKIQNLKVNRYMSTKTAYIEGVVLTYRGDGLIEQNVTKLIEVKYTESIPLKSAFQLRGTRYLKKDTLDYDQIQCYMKLYGVSECWYALDNLEEEPHHELILYDETYANQLFEPLRNYQKLGIQKVTLKKYLKKEFHKHLD